MGCFTPLWDLFGCANPWCYFSRYQGTRLDRNPVYTGEANINCLGLQMTRKHLGYYTKWPHAPVSQITKSLTFWGLMKHMPFWRIRNIILNRRGQGMGSTSRMGNKIYWELFTNMFAFIMHDLVSNFKSGIKIGWFVTLLYVNYLYSISRFYKRGKVNSNIPPTMWKCYWDHVFSSGMWSDNIMLFHASVIMDTRSNHHGTCQTAHHTRGIMVQSK